MDETRTFEFKLTIDELHLLGETIEEARLDALKQLESGVLVLDDVEYFREKERILQAILAATPEWNTRPSFTDARLVEAHQRLRETLQYCLGGLLAVREMLGNPDFAANHIKMAEEALGEVV